MLIFVLDTETTAKDNPRIIEMSVGIMDVQNARDFNSGITLRTERYLPPEPITVGAMATHNITNEMVADKQPFSDGILINLLGQYNVPENILVAHNAPFDIQALKNEGVDIKMRVVDTYRCCKHMLANRNDIESYSLSYMKYYLRLDLEEKPIGVETQNMDAHTAAGDVLTTYYLFRRMCNKEGLAKLLEYTEMPILLEKFRFGKHEGKYIKDIVSTDINYAFYILNKMTNPDPDLVYTIKYWMAAQNRSKNEQPYKPAKNPGKDEILIPLS